MTHIRKSGTRLDHMKTPAALMSRCRRAGLGNIVDTFHGALNDRGTSDIMFTIILQSADNKWLATVAKPGNDSYLIRDEAVFPLLGDLSDSSYDVFGHEQIPELIAELRRVRDELQAPEDVAHVDDIIALAERCVQGAWRIPDPHAVRAPAPRAAERMTRK